MSEQQHTLRDNEIQLVLDKEDKHYQETLNLAHAILQKHADAPDDAEIAIQLGLLRQISRALMGLEKLTSGSRGGITSNAKPTGDRGSGCDYNPFKQIDHDGGG